ncbi:ArnT family glycosyltransferase [Patescibacteria group bacterium]
MITKLKNQVKHLPLIIILLIAFSLRFINLGYSDYQGDEIKAFFKKDANVSTANFLLNQRKGPGQFFVTYAIKFINPNYSNELVSRFPFAFAGGLSVFFLYKLVELHFGKKVAFYSSFFFATNGFFVALSRIVQYQSFVILFMVCALYYLSLSMETEKYKYKGLFLGLFFWALSVLFHYDGVFIAPLGLFLIFSWVKKNVKKFNFSDNNFKKLFKYSIVSLIFVLSFYIPFVFNLSQNTLSYWSGRVTGDVSSKLSSSKYLFTVYQPIYVVHFYLVLALSGSAYLITYAFKILLKGRKNTFMKVLNLLPFDKEFSAITFFYVLWILVPLVFLEAFVYIPGTHIYTYLLPLSVLLAFGIVYIEKIIHLFKRFIHPNVISYAGIALLFVFLYLQSYAIFVDNTEEYPWESERFLIWELHQPTPIFHLSMFGFPYYRNWEGISNVIVSSDNNGYYSTNERSSIARHFVPLNKSTNDAGHYIHILKPQSFNNKIQHEKAAYWSERYHPIFTFSRNGEDLVRVYYMESGKLEEIIEKGY